MIHSLTQTKNKMASFRVFKRAVSSAFAHSLKSKGCLRLSRPAGVIMCKRNLTER